MRNDFHVFMAISILILSFGGFFCFFNENIGIFIMKIGTTSTCISMLLIVCYELYIDLKRNKYEKKH